MGIDPDFVAQVARFAKRKGRQGGFFPTDVPGLRVSVLTQPTALETTVYNPVICAVLQGRKDTNLGQNTVSFGAGESLIVSHTVPVIAAVTEASPTKPYIALIQTLDLSIARSLYYDLETSPRAKHSGRTLDVGATDAKIVDCLQRLFGHAMDPTEAQALAPLVVRELHFQLLRARHGAMIRQLLDTESKASRIDVAITAIQEHFKTPLHVTALADLAGMSASAFHKHFKDITTYSPLQFQKELRLVEARRHIQLGDKSISEIAYDVGYRSLSQFSRDYTRRFGASPRADR